ncbi:MAG: hypothetical protein AB7O97_06125 [Planctomycetota bacterium]
MPSFLLATRLIPSGAMALLLAATPAQAPMAWSPLSPPGGVNPAALQATRAMLVYRDGLYLRMWSAITRQWYPGSLSFGTTPQLSDHVVAIPEDHQWTCFSAFTGTSAVLPNNLATTTSAGSASLFAVRDGDTAHVYSAYTGQWHTHTVPAGWSLQLGERIAAFGNSVFTVGGPSQGAAVFDGFSGQWHDVAGRAEQQIVRVSGGTALLLFETSGLGFSTQLGAPVALPGPVGAAGGALSTQSPTDLINYRGAVFSGISGAFAQPPFPPQPFGNSPSYWNSGLVTRGRVIASPDPLVMGTSGWIPVPGGTGAGGDQLTYTSFGDADGVTVHAFSALTNQVASHTFSAPSPNGLARDHFLVVADGGDGQPWFYSGLTGQWHASPANVLPFAGPVLTFGVGDAGMILRTTTGLTGFSARTGEFTPLGVPGLTLVGGHSTAIGAYDATTLYVFDAGKGRWLGRPIQIDPGQPPLVSTVGWPSSVLLAEDPTRVVGFAARAGHFDVLTPTEPVLGRGLLADVGWVRTAQTVWAFSGFGDVVAWAGLPEDLIGVGRGGQLHQQVRLSDGDFAFLGIGAKVAAPVSLPPLGMLWIDPQFSEVRFLAGAPGSDRALLQLAVPNDAVFANTEWFAQALMAPAGRAAYLAEPVDFRLF